MWHATKVDPVGLHSNAFLICMGYDSIDERIVI